MRVFRTNLLRRSGRPSANADGVPTRMTRSSSNRAEISEPSLLIRINRTYRDGMSETALYEATRGVWVLGPRRELARWAFAVAHGEIKAVFEIDAWHPAGTTPYSTRSAADVRRPGRWEFCGRPAPPVMRDRFLGLSVSHYFSRGNQNPVAYVAMPDDD